MSCRLDADSDSSLHVAEISLGSVDRYYKIAHLFDFCFLHLINYMSANALGQTRAHVSSSRSRFSSYR